eukprot:2934370-Prymnesium_polylepis.1
MIRSIVALLAHLQFATSLVAHHGSVPQQRRVSAAARALSPLMVCDRTILSPECRLLVVVGRARRVRRGTSIRRLSEG